MTEENTPPREDLAGKITNNQTSDPCNPTPPQAKARAENFRRSLANNTAGGVRDPGLYTLALQAGILGSQLDMGNRDLYQDCKYPTTISPAMFLAMYEREGVAARVVEMWPMETWKSYPDLYDVEDEETESEFETAWQKLVKDHGIFQQMLRWDIVSGIGSFGVLLLGFNDANLGAAEDEKDALAQPLPGFEEGPPDDEFEGSKDVELIYLKSFHEQQVSIHKWDNDPASPRYGQPVLYSLKLFDPSLYSNSATTPTAMNQEIKVHWSRVLHLADNCTTSDLFGTPRQKPVYNRLLDLRKIYGGSGEMFWRGAFPGYAFTVNPALLEQGVELDTESLRTEMENYADHLQRYIANVGIETNSLAVQIGDPSKHVEVMLMNIAMTIGIPWRKFMGSEEGKLASEQDGGDHADRLKGRRLRHAGDRMLIPFAKRLVQAGALPAPKDGNICCEWPDLHTPSELDRAEIALKRTQALTTYASGNAHEIVPELEWLTQWMDMSQDEAKAILDAAEKRQAELQAEEEAQAAELAKQMGSAQVGPDGKPIIPQGGAVPPNNLPPQGPHPQQPNAPPPGLPQKPPGKVPKVA